MGEFHDAVSTLLQAFTSGISIIKTQRGRRKQNNVAIDPARKEAESTLSRSLKQNRKEVKNAYEKDVAAFGEGFRAGDDEARSRLATILLRLNAGFVSIIERFTRGKSSPADYQSLISLSNTSRIEAMRTFEQLSHRISQSSLALVPANSISTPRRRKRSRKKGSSSGKSKRAMELANTPLGVANTEGWVRPKHGRKLSSESMKSSASSSHRREPLKQLPQNSNVVKALPASTQTPLLPPSKVKSSAPPSPPPLSQKTPPPAYRNHTANRKSIMSFASDSTKIGEIPEHRWAGQRMFDVVEQSGEGRFPINAFYPLEPYQEPQKKSRLRKLFGRS